MAVLKMEDACAQAGCRFARRGLGSGDADGRGGWHATGTHPAWGMPCMWLGCSGTTGVPQASPHFPKEEKAPGLSGPLHPTLSLLQEDSAGGGLQPAHSAAPRPALGKQQRFGRCWGDAVKAVS